MGQTESVGEYRTAYLQNDFEKLQDVRNETQLQRMKQINTNQETALF